jgi:DNA-binding XRE family transcriptional regulator
MTPEIVKPIQESLIKKKYQPPKEIKPEHKELMLKVGRKLETLRKVKKISTSKLSKELGISRNSYSNMEYGKVYFNVLTLLQVLDYYQVSALEFFSDL